MTEPIASLEDLDFDLCRRAHEGTSFVPEDRAVVRQREYVAHIEAVYAELIALTGEERAADVRAAVVAYRDGWLSRQRKHLAARSRCVNTMIVGPANFPIARQRKRLDVADKRMQEVLAYQERALSALRRQFQAPTPPAADRLAAARAEHQRMLDANAAWRRRDAAALAALMDGHPRYGRPGQAPYPSYALTNSRARIASLETTIAAEAQRAAVAESFAPVSFAASDDHPAGTLAIEDERVTLAFHERTSKACYDRKHTAEALRVARALVGITEPA